MHSSSSRAPIANPVVAKALRAGRLTRTASENGRGRPPGTG
jgi:hypothetical protein